MSSRLHANATIAVTELLVPRSISLALLASVVASLFVPTMAAGAGTHGAWGPVTNWPLIPLHAALTPDGRVLSYGTKADGTQTGFFIYDVWEPSGGPAAGHLTLNNMTRTDLFCSAQLILPNDGDLLLVGGDNWTGHSTNNLGNNNSNVFSPTGNTLTRGSNMSRPRWYATMTTLVNGEIYIQGGDGGGDLPEIYDAQGGFHLLVGANTSYMEPEYPRNFLAPDGRVFGYDTFGNMYFVVPAGSGSISYSGVLPRANMGKTSSAAMFQTGKILQFGGNSNGAIVIDITGPTPKYAATRSMSTQREWVSATVLADGRVLATGGSGWANVLWEVNNTAEIWDPAIGQWTLDTSGVKARLYHSTALLLPDASVLVGGGGAPGPLTNTNVEIYYPPYLFTASGARAPRPTISSAPATLNVGEAFSMQVDSTAVSRVTLVRTGSDTHSLNMDQRFLDLPFVASGNGMQVTLPARATDTPPGYYLLFVIDGNGVPSVGKIVQMNIPSPAPVDFTPVIGGGDGWPYLLACNANQVLAGVYGVSGLYGVSGPYVYDIGPQCVGVDQSGHWTGKPVNQPMTGGQHGSPNFAKTCPPDSAVIGFRGRSDAFVEQLDVQCGSLSSGVAGAFLGPVGGTGGTAQAPQYCTTGNPLYAIAGRSSSWLNNFGGLCRRAGAGATFSVGRK